MVHFVKIRSVIENCYQKDLRNILIITGKGLRSKVKENPYLSEDLSLLKYAIPNFLKDNFSDIINSMDEPDQSLGGCGCLSHPCARTCSSSNARVRGTVGTLYALNPKP